MHLLEVGVSKNVKSVSTTGVLVFSGTRAPAFELVYKCFSCPRSSFLPVCRVPNNIVPVRISRKAEGGRHSLFTKICFLVLRLFGSDDVPTSTRKSMATFSYIHLTALTFRRGEIKTINK